MKLMQNPMMQ
jgi:hypothetical protein